MIDFPASPTLGQQFTAAGVTWTWDGVKWTANGLSVAYLPLSGGTMTGPILLAADPTAALGAATKQYVDARAGDGANRIINGDMRIDQRNNGASGTLAGYTIDRWSYQASQASKLTWGRGASPSMAAQGFPYVFGFTSSSAYTPVAADTFNFQQRIEADMISDFAWGTASAQPVTLSFWVNSSLTGTFGGVIRNLPASATRAYPFSFSIPVASAWTKIVINIPGDIAGTWTTSGNGIGLVLQFDLGNDPAARGPANAWTSTNYTGVTGSVNVVGTNGATFSMTGVKLEIGSVATPYNRQSLTRSMADCQRYYATMVVFFTGYQAAATGFGQTVTWPVTMRGNPTVAFVSPAYINASGITNSANSLSSGAFSATATATGPVNAQATMTLSSEL